MTSREEEALARELELLRAEAKSLGFSDEAAEPDWEHPDHFIARMKGAEAQPSVEVPTIRRSRTRMLVGVAAAAAAALVAVVVLRPASSPVVADTPPVLDYEFASAVRIAFAPGQDPSESLKLLARASETDGAASGFGPVQHHVTDNWFSDQDEQGTSVITPRITESWLQADGSLTTVSSVGEQLRSDGRGVPTAAPTYSDEPITEELPAGSIDANFPSTLSRDPEVLRKQLLAHGGCSQDPEPSSARSFCLYNEVRALFQTWVIEPDLAAAIWRSLLGEEGFSSLGSVEDRAGRNGLGISFIGDQRPQYRFILIGSTETGQLLGTEELVIKRDPDLDIDPPAVVSFTTITVADRVDTGP